MATSIGKLYALVGANTTEFDAKMAALGKRAAVLGKSLTMFLTLPILAIGAASVKFSADFEQSMKNAQSVSGATADELKMMEGVAREMGKTTVFSAKEAADAFYYMASAGWKANQMAVAIKPTLDLAAATQSDLAFTTNTVVASLNQFGLASSEAGRVTNVFAAAIGNSQATLEKLKISMTYIGPLANAVGYSIEQTTGTLMSLYDAGYEASSAGTALRMALAKLMQGTGKTREGLESLGLSMADVNPATNSLVEIIRKLEDAGADATAIINIFGVRAGPAMAAAIAQGADKIEDYTKTITGTESASEMAAIQLDTLKGQAKLLTSAMGEVALQIGKVVVPVIRNFIKNQLQPAVLWFSNLSEEARKNVIKWALIVAAIGPAIMIFGKAAIAIGALNKGFKALRVAMGTKLLGPIGLITVAIITLTKTIYDSQKGFRDFYNTLEEFDEVSKENVSTLEKVTAGAKGMLLKMGATYKLLLKVSGATKKWTEEQHNLKEKTAELTEKQREHGKEVWEAIKGTDLYNKTLGKQAKKAEEAKSKLEKMNEAVKKALQAQEKAKEAAKAFNDTLKSIALETIPQKIAKMKELEGKLAIVDGLWAKNKITMGDWIRVSSELRQQISDLSVGITTSAIPAARDMAGVFEQAVTKMKGITFLPTKEIGTDWKALNKEIEADTIRSIANIIKTGGNLWEGMKGIFDNIVGYWIDKVVNEIVKGGDDIWGTLKKGFSGLSGSISGVFSNVGGAVKGLGGLIGGAAGKAGNFVGDLIGKFGKLAGPIGAAISIGMKLPIIGDVIKGITGKVAGLLSKIPLIGGLFKKSETEAEKAAREMKEMVDGLISSVSKWGDITEETAKAIAEDIKGGMEGAAAVSKNYADVLKDVGVTQKSISDQWDRATGILANYADGILDAEDASQAASESFSILLDSAKKFGTEGSESMVSFIKQVKASGLEIAEVTGYINDQLGVVKSGSINAAQGLEAMAGAVGTNVESLGRLETQTLAVFNAMIANGASYSEAMNSLGGTLDAIIKKHEELGTEASAGIQELLKIRGVTEANKELFSAMEGNLAVLNALGNTGSLTQELFNNAAVSATDYYNQMMEAGLDGNQALVQMAPTLERLRYLAKEQGLQIDDTTKSMIKQAEEQGILGKEQMSIQDTLMAGFGAIIEAIGGKVPEAFRKAMDKMRDFADDSDDAFNRVKDGVGGIQDSLNDLHAPDLTFNVDGNFSKLDKQMKNYTIAAEPAGGGGGGGKNVAWQTGFEGIVRKPMMPLIGEVPEYVSVQPLSKGGGPKSGDVNMKLEFFINNQVDPNFTRKYVQHDLLPAIMTALETGARKTKMKEIMGVA